MSDEASTIVGEEETRYLTEEELRTMWIHSTHRDARYVLGQTSDDYELR